MSNEYGSCSSRHERRSSRWAKKDSDVVEAAANQAIKHLEETEDKQPNDFKTKIDTWKNAQNPLSNLWITDRIINSFGTKFLCFSFVENCCDS